MSRFRVKHFTGAIHREYICTAPSYESLVKRFRQLPPGHIWSIEPA